MWQDPVLSYLLERKTACIDTAVIIGRWKYATIRKYEHVDSYNDNK